MSRIAVIAVLLGAWVASAPALAESILLPRTGAPALVVPGGLLEVTALAEGTLSLEGAGPPISLDATWSPGAGGAQLGRAVVPVGTAPGRYTLLVAGATAPAQREGAVHVLAAFPEDYAIAIVRGAKSDDVGESTPALPVDLGARLSAESVQLAILLGPLTRGGSEEEYVALEALLVASEVPVYLCPDASESRSPIYRKHFGDGIRGVTFGRDGFLFLGAGLTAVDPQSHARLGEAHRLRRAMRASRWSVGVASAYGLDWDLRAQIALFVDDPLNFLIAGYAPAELGATLPWGKTQFALPASAPPAPLTALEVSATGIRLRPEPEATEAPAEAAAVPSEAQVLAAE